MKELLIDKINKYASVSELWESLTSIALSNFFQETYDEVSSAVPA